MRHVDLGRKTGAVAAGSVLALVATFLVTPLLGAASATTAPVPFACTSPMDFTAPNGTQLVETAEGTATATAVGGVSTFAYNALAYNAADHFLYALATGNGILVRVDSTGAASPVGNVSGLPTPAHLSSYSSGTFDDEGIYWVVSNDPAATIAYGIDVASLSVVATRNLTQTFTPTDWTFADGYLWGLDGDVLTRVQLGTGTAAEVVAIPFPGNSAYGYNAAWTFADGTLGFLRSDTNEVVRITLNQYFAYGSSTTEDLTGATAFAANNDGASCSPGIAITSDAAAGTIHVPYSAQFTAVGGSAPYTWSLADGSSLPDGLHLDAATGAVAGTPTVAGTFVFTVSVTDSSGQVAEHAETIKILPGPFTCAAPTAFVSPTDANDRTQLIAITETSTPTSGPLGDPSAIGYNALGYDRDNGFLYAIAIANGPLHQTGNHLLRIDSGGNVVDLGAVTDLPPVNADSEYPSGAFDDAGTFWVFSQSDPSTAYGIDVDTLAVTHRVTLDAPFGANDWTYDLGYLWGVSGGVVYQADLTTGHVASETFSTTITGDVNAMWTNADTSLGFVFSTEPGNHVNRLPVQPGPLTASSLGTLTNTTAGPVVHLAADQNDGSACLPALQLTTAPGTASGTYGQTYSGAVQAAGGIAPYTWTLTSGALPAGLTLSSDGTITGTPTAAGPATFTAQVTDSAADPQTASLPVTITIHPATLTITASGGSMVYGGTVPTITPSYSGFVAPDDASAVSGLSCSTAATATSDVGTYPSTCSGGTATNYSITYVGGHVTVTPAGQAVTFTSTPPDIAQVGGSYAVSATGGASGNPVTFSIDPTSTAGACTISATTVTFTGTGSCIIDGDQAGSLDYTAAATARQQVIVGYRTSGFLPPVSNAPKVNTGKAGRTYPLKWQLQQADGSYVTSLDAVRSIAIRSTSCSAFSDDPTSAVTATTTGGTSLRYDTATNQYVFNWQASSRGCFSVFVTLSSGQVLMAFFSLS